MEILCDVIDGWMLYFCFGKHFVYLFILLLSFFERDKSFIIEICEGSYDTSSSLMICSLWIGVWEGEDIIIILFYH